MLIEFEEPMKTDPDTIVDISILNVAITEGVINREKGKALPPQLHAYDSFNVGNILTVFETLQNGMDPTVQVDAWKAKLLATGDKTKKEVQEEINADLDSRTMITRCPSTSTYFPREGYTRMKRKPRHPRSM